MFTQFGSVKRSPRTLCRPLHSFKVASISDCFSDFFRRLLGIEDFTQHFSCTLKQPVNAVLQTSRTKKFRKFHRLATLLENVFITGFFEDFTKFFRKVFLNKFYGWLVLFALKGNFPPVYNVLKNVLTSKHF